MLNWDYDIEVLEDDDYDLDVPEDDDFELKLEGKNEH